MNFIGSLLNIVNKKFSSHKHIKSPRYINYFPDSHIEDVFVSDPAEVKPKSLLDYAQKDILNAKKEVDFSFFVIDKGKEFRHLLDIIAKLYTLNPSVKINIITNTKDNAEDISNKFKQKHIPVNIKAFNSKSITSAFKSDHTKYIVIDDKLAFVTDQNIQDKPSIDSGYRWYGLTSKLEGKAVKGIKEIFKYSWNTSSKVNLVNSPEFIKLDSKGYGKKVSLKDIKNYINGKLDLKGIIVSYSEPWNNIFFKHIIFRENDLRHLIKNSIANARKQVRIITPNLSSVPIIKSIVKALARGAKVEIILSKDFNEDINLIPDLDNIGDNIKALLYLKFLAGDKINNLQVRWYSNDGKRPAVGNDTFTSHAKYVSVDGKLAAYGSRNQDITSEKICRELNIIDLNEEEIYNFEESFFPQVWNRSIPVDFNKLPNPAIYFFKSFKKAAKSVFKRTNK